jgi:uncharacterized protein YyaL (SSP411 family)
MIVLSMLLATGLEWKSWGKEAFDEAKREHKLVFVDAGIEGCTACRNMHEWTLADPRVVARLEKEFVVISVDADQQPDLGARFDDWAWPALVFFDADGRMIYANRGSRTPEHFLADLDDVERRASAAASAKPVAAPAPKPSSPAQASCAAALAEIDARMAQRSGPAVIAGIPYVVEYARDDAHAAIAAKFVQQTSAASDPVWGGVYAGSHPTRDGGSAPIPEKRADFEAAALELYAAAFAKSHDETARKGIDDVERYLASTLTAPDGTFYSTQRDVPPTLPKEMSVADYYKLDDAGRRKIGVPAVDHGVYADQNGRLITALAHAADATGDAKLLAMAARAANAIRSSRMRSDGFITQVTASDIVTRDPRLRPTHDDDRQYLRAQAAFGNAAVALYSASGDEIWAAVARKMASALVTSTLADRERGGFFDADARDVDSIIGRKKSVSDNIAAARFLFGVAELKHDEELRAIASKTLAFVGAAGLDDTIDALGHDTLALAEDARGIVDVSVTGADTAAATALLKTARSTFAPSKIVRPDVDARYPKPDKGAVAYVCDRNACSPPISDAAKLTTMIARTALPFACEAR